MTRTLTALFSFLFLASNALAQATPEQASKAIVEESSAKIKEAVLSAKTDDEMREKVKVLMETFVDFQEFGRICLIDHFDKLSKADQQRYLAEFKKLLQRSYLRRFKAGRDFKLTYRGEPQLNKTGDRVMVKTTLASGDVTADVDYRFFKSNDKWLAYDIIIDEVSMSRNYRKSFAKIMDKDGLEELLKKMAKKSQEDGDNDDI